MKLHMGSLKIITIIIVCIFPHNLNFIHVIFNKNILNNIKINNDLNFQVRAINQLKVRVLSSNIIGLNLMTSSNEY